MFFSPADLDCIIWSKMARVAGSLPAVWRCLECDYTSSRNQNVAEHVESKHVQHAGYFCELCNQTCTSKSAFRMHNQRKHKQKL